MTKEVMLPEVKPNAGVEHSYRDWLLGVVNDVHRQTVSAIKDGLRATGLAQDSAVGALGSMMNVVGVRLQQSIDRLADQQAKRFAEAVLKNADVSLFASMSEYGLVAKRDMTPAIANAFDAVRAQNVALIKSIPEQYHRQVEVLVNDAIARNDVDGLSVELHKRYKITRRRAELIAKDQCKKATVALTRARQIQQGFTTAKWVHTGLSEKPRPSHKRANGKKFSLRKGRKIDGEYIFPGEKINCTCGWRPLITPPPSNP